MKQLPIRLRLTVWYVVVFSLALVAFGTSAWLLVRQRLYADVVRQLQFRTDSVERFMGAQKPAITLVQMQQELSEEYGTEDQVQWLQIVDQDGVWMFRAQPMMQLAPTTDLPQTLPSRGRSWRARSGRARLLVLERPITVGGHLYTVEGAIETNGIYHTLVGLRNVLLLLAPAMIVIAALGSYWMSRRALSAVDDITAKARSIHETNLDSRLPSRQTNDELQRLSDTLNDMLARIETSFKRTRQFTADASHELRTPMSLIRTEAELTLRKSRSESEYRAALEHIQEESVRTTELIESLLTLARTDSGADTIQLRPVPCLAFLREVADDWKAMFVAAGLEFRTSLLDDASMVNADTTLLRRLLVLLLDNARKYTPRGGTVTLAAEADASRFRISVSDTGIGIEPEHLPKIFDRFYRADKARSRGEGGAGLGLSLAKWIAAQHHAELKVESASGKGSRFSFDLAKAKGDVERNFGLNERAEKVL